MKNVVVDVGADGTDPLASQRPANLPPGVPWESGHQAQVVNAPVTNAPANPWDDASTIAHRSMLADEERRLQVLRARNPIPQIPDITPLPFSHLSGAQRKPVVVRHDADPLLVEAFETLSTLVAGGLISPAYDKSKVLSVMQKIERSIEYVPAQVVTAPAPVTTAPEVGSEKKS